MVCWVVKIQGDFSDWCAEMQVSGFPSALHLAFSRGILHQGSFLQFKTFPEVKAENPTNIAEEGSFGAYQACQTSNKQPHLITIASHFVLARSDFRAFFTSTPVWNVFSYLPYHWICTLSFQSPSLSAHHTTNSTSISWIF